MSSPTTATTPPPSAFSHFATLAESSAAAATRNSRRNNSAGPRPLHLAAGSITGSAPGSPARTGSPLLLPSDDGPVTAPYSPRAGPSTPLSPTISGLRNGSARRQSSISYKSSGTHSPSPSQSSFGGFAGAGSSAKRDSVDIGNFLGPARSPLAGSATAVGGGGLTRSRSLGAKRAGGVNVASEQPARSSVDGTERAPVTLVEKHAELLHFIAQKESKCLELRSQLAVHEAELLELKKKWERIVNRGFERSQATSSTSGKMSYSPTLTTGLAPAFAASKSDSSSVSSNSNSSYFPTLIPAPNAPSAIVLEGIKESVQGVSRFLAAGLETIAQVNANAPTTTPTGSHADGHTRRGLTPEPPTTSITSSTRSISPHRAITLTRKSGQGHEQKESQSSTASAASNASMASSLLSVSTASSATSAAPSEGLGSSSSSSTGPLTPTLLPTSSRKSSEGESDNEFGAFEEGRPSAGSVQRQRRDEEEVLMVRDTGATPTMSPNPDFQRRTLQPSEVDEHEFDWDDGWGNLDGDGEGDVAPEEVAEVPHATVVQASEARSTPAKPLSTAGGTNATSKPALPGALAGQQMSSWVGSMGKKWGEIKGSQTFTKSQKRASLLLSDMQQSFVSALIAPTPLSASGTVSERSPSSSLSSTTNFTPAYPSSSLSASTATSLSSSPSPFSSNSSSSTRNQAPLSAHTLGRATSGSGSSTNPKGSRLQPPPELSLLDDSDESFGEGDRDDTVRLTMSAPVLVPTAVSASTSAKSTSLRQSGRQGSKDKVNAATTSTPSTKQDTADDDEWNW